MPFCRKCGRRLVEYSECCPDCGTSTTAPMVNFKKASRSHNFKAPEKGKVIRAVLPPASPVVIKVKSPSKASAPTEKHEIAAEILIPPQAKAPAPAKRPVKIAPPAEDAPIKIFVPPKASAAAKPIFSTKHKLTTKRKVTLPPRVVIRPTEVTTEPPLARQPPKPAAQIQKPKPEKPPAPPKPAEASKPVVPPKPVTPAPVYPPHKIIKSNVSVKEDILANPHDYESESFEFDLTCENGHFFAEGTSLPVSKGKAYCPQCGEQLRKPKPKHGRRRYHRY
ncbi:MAG: hypothetical protein NWE93_03845 [Candidatus Bathyarchaeota archaeon]|nr:hypothetical protein [Candidatus Bathyarchaeota archaeon]